MIEDGWGIMRRKQGKKTGGLIGDGGEGSHASVQDESQKNCAVSGENKNGRYGTITEVLKNDTTKYPFEVRN